MENLTLELLPNAVCELFNKIENIERLLQQSSTNNTPESDQLLTIQQAASLINLTVPTLYGLVAKSAIPNMKRNKRLYFSKIELINWIQQGKRKTIAEIKTDAENFLSNHKNKS